MTMIQVKYYDDLYGKQEFVEEIMEYIVEYKQIGAIAFRYSGTKWLLIKIYLIRRYYFTVTMKTKQEYGYLF